MELNQPRWTGLDLSGSSPFVETWHLLVSDPMQGRSFWLRFSVLLSANRFRRVGEVSAMVFGKADASASRQIALKQGFDIGSFNGNSETIRLGTAELGQSETVGVLRSKGRTLQWDLKFRSLDTTSEYPLFFGPLTLLNAAQTHVSTVRQGIQCEGSIDVDGERLSFSGAFAIQRHTYGRRLDHSWMWSYCDQFQNTEGGPADFRFELITTTPWIAGKVRGLKMSALKLKYQGHSYWMNSVASPLKLRSEMNGSEWKFRADRGELSFQGLITAENRDFSGLTCEDSDGSLTYLSSTLIAQSTIRVFRRGKMEASLNSGAGTALEIADRTRSPYVSVLS